MKSPTTIPVEATSFLYIPECLADVEGAPTFRLRYGTRRDRHAYQDELNFQRIRSYSTEDIREAVIDEFRSKWASDELDIDALADRIRAFYDDIDALDKAATEWVKECAEIEAENEGLVKAGKKPREWPPRPQSDLDAVEREKISGLIEEIETASERLGRIRRDNNRRERMIRQISLALLLEETSMDVPLKRGRDGFLTDETLYALEDALEKQFSDDGQRAAFWQVGTQALLTFFLGKEEEKNSPSPSPGTSSPNGSTAQESESSTSEGSELKTPEPALTPETSSPTPTPT